MFDKHQIIVDKEKKTYTYTIEHYLTKEHSRNATVIPKADTTSISREEFLELAYHKDIDIFIVGDASKHPFIDGATIQKLREPEPFEVL